MKFLKLSLFALLTGIFTPQLKAEVLSFGGYAVANHSPCGLNSLPATTRELEKLFAHPDFGTFFSKNFYWSNARVRQRDWSTMGDHSDSVETANSFDGVDASQLSYIASHGGTSSDVYMGSMGSRNDGGCDIRSSDMRAGDQNARYIVLSTCQGVKIGTGDSPTRPGADPSRTWKSTITSGLHCIYGYSNNMADADNYGTYLLEYMKNNDNTIVENFFTAGRNVDRGNLPAAVCFGATSEEATAHLNQDKDFLTTPNVGGVSVWSYDSLRILKSNQSFAKTANIPQQVRVVNLTAPMKFKSMSGMVSHQKHSLVFRRSGERSVAALNMTDEEVIDVAKTFIAEQGLNHAEATLIPTAIVDRGFSSEGLENQRIIGKTVIFSQEVFGELPLESAGSVEVYVEHGGVIGSFRSNLKAFEAQEKMMGLASVNLQSKLSGLKADLESRFPGSSVKLLSQSVGYDVGTELEPNTVASLALRAEFEVTKNGSGRRYIEKINL